MYDDLEYDSLTIQEPQRARARWYTRLWPSCLGQGFLCCKKRKRVEFPLFLIGYDPVGQFQRAASVGDVASVERFINSREYHINECDRRRRTPLHYACAHNHPEVVRILLSNSAYINIQDDEGCTPLIKATQRDNIECVTLLLMQGADVHLKDFSGDAALHHAVCRGNTEIASKLLDYNADIDMKTKYGLTPYKLALFERNQEMVQFLIQNGANIHSVVKPNSEGTSPEEAECSKEKHVTSNHELKFNTDSMPLSGTGRPSQQTTPVLRNSDLIHAAIIRAQHRMALGAGRPSQQTTPVLRNSDPINTAIIRAQHRMALGAGRPSQQTTPVLRNSDPINTAIIRAQHRMALGAGRPSQQTTPVLRNSDPINTGADLLLLQEDLPEDEARLGVDDCSSESDEIVTPSALDFVSEDEMLIPLGRLDKNAASENIFNRQMVAQHLLNTLREVCDDEGDCVAVLERIGRLADDSEPTVRAELMGQVPHIALFCQENQPSIPYAFSKYLLPIVVRYLADQNNQVRKTSQAALLALLEQELIEPFDVETKVYPVLIELTAPDSNDDVKTEAVAIMCKMAPMVGKDITERLILPRFCDCRMFPVREVCAANFGDICSAVGQQATEEVLLPMFYQLCSDNVWGVRKACAECFMAVSRATCQEIRRTKLSALFIKLISDPSRWVRQSAFRSLGPFISTFANPSSSGQCFREEGKSSEDVPAEGKSRIKDHDAVEEERIRPEDAPADFSARLESALEDCAAEPSGNSAGDISVAEPANCKSAFWPEVGTSSSDSTLLDQESFNSFHFWRTPLLEIDLDRELQQDSGETLSPERTGDAPGVPGPGSPNITMATRKEVEEMTENLEPHMDDPDVKAQVEVLSAALRASSLDAQEEDSSGEHRSELQDELGVNELPDCNVDQDASVPLIGAAEESIDATPHYVLGGADVIASGGFSPDEERRPKVQDVVPQALLDLYLSMTEPSLVRTVDTEIAKHCAYSLPGVALTLGRQNWHCLRETYKTLASDRRCKVRRTLAFSIHELAVILGDQLTAADLVPIFNGFLQDLDEVRIGVLKHLRDFLKLLHIDKRREYLHQLQEFLVTGNSRNWRFRAELGEQLILLLELYSPRDVYDYLRPIALNLCADKVSSVRWISYKLVSEMVKKLHTATPPTFGLDLISELVENLGRSPKWSGRQAFVSVCQTVIEDDCLPMDQFAVHLMPHLLTLANDRVPNVRMLLAKTLRQTLLEKEYFLASASCHQEAVEQTIMALQMDRDSDVKYFASIHPSSTKISEDAMRTASLHTDEVGIQDYLEMVPEEFQI